MQAPFALAPVPTAHVYSTFDFGMDSMRGHDHLTDLGAVTLRKEHIVHSAVVTAISDHERDHRAVLSSTAGVSYAKKAPNYRWLYPNNQLWLVEYITFHPKQVRSLPLVDWHATSRKEQARPGSESFWAMRS
ncbi:hypothetical protein [Pseudomonas mohnii]